MICHHVSRTYVHHLELDRRLSTIYHGILRLDPPSMIFGRRLQLHRPSIIYYATINDLWPTFATTSTINHLLQILSTASNINDSPKSVKQFLPLELKHGEKIITLFIAYRVRYKHRLHTDRHRDTQTHRHTHTSTHEHTHTRAQTRKHARPLHTRASLGNRVTSTSGPCPRQLLRRGDHDQKHAWIETGQL